jgi:hypothetical protein
MKDEEDDNIIPDNEDIWMIKRKWSSEGWQ